MSSIGTGYDLAASTFSPDGRIFQIEYAQKAVDNGGTAIALRGKDGVVVGVEKLISSRLYEPVSNPRILNVDSHIGFACAGLYPDAKGLAKWCQEEAVNYYHQHRSKIPLKYLTKQLGHYVHNYTLSILRPFGCAVFLSSWDEKEGPKLTMVEPSGLHYGYQGWAMGKHQQAAKTEIEKLKLNTYSMTDLVKEAARIILTVRDETKDKNWKFEAGWVGEKTGGKHEMVPDDVVQEAMEWAKAKVEQEEDEEMD